MSDRTVSVGLRADVAGFVAGIRTAQREVSVFTDSLNKNAAKKQALTDLGNTAGKVGLIAAAGLGIAIKSAADFDSAMSSVEAATHASAGTMEDLRKAALEAGARTVYSATEAAGAIESLSKAGISAADIMGGGLNGALSLAAAGSIDVADAADAAATAMTQFNLSGKDIPHVADLLAAGAGKAQGEVSDMAMALKQSGLVASQFGMSIEETVGTLAAFASAGLLGSDAGTSFKTMLLRLANPSAGAAKTMERLGIAAYDANGAFIGTTALAGQLQKALQNKTQAERDAALATIFGSDAIRAANVLYKDGAAGIADWVTQTNDFNYANDTAAMKLDNLKGDLEKLSGALENAFIGTGDGAQGPLREMVQGVTALVDAFNSLPAPAKNTVAALGAITAVTGGGLWFGSKVIRGIADTRQSLADLGATAPKTANALTKVGKAVGIAGTAFAAFEIASSLGDKSGDPAIRRWVEEFEALAGTNPEDKIAALRDEIGKLEDATHNTALESFLFGNDKAIFGIGGEEQRTNLARLKALREELAELEHQKKLDAIASGDTTVATAGLAGAEGAMAAAAAKAEAQQKALTAAIEESRKAASETAHEFFGIGDAVDDANVSLTGWIHDLEEQARALHDFRVNAEKAAENGLRKGLIAALEEAGPAGALRMKQLANASEAEIRRANQAWGSGQREIGRYVDAIGGVPVEVNTKVNVDTKAALAALSLYKGVLGSLPASAPKPSADTLGELMGGRESHNARGTSFWRGGMTWVGEEGPELVNLPRGAQVYSAARSAQFVTRASGHGTGSASQTRAREGSMKVSGTLHIPGFGTAQIRGIAAEVFADEYGYEQRGRVRA